VGYVSQGVPQAMRAASTLPRGYRRTIVAVLLVGAGLWGSTGLFHSGLAQQRGADSVSTPSIPVTIAPVARQDVPILLRNIGAVQAFQAVVVRTRVDGTLDQVFFTEGQDVKRGDRLALIDPRPYAATLAQAQAKRAFDQVQLENAKRDLARTQSLVRSDFASRQQLDTQTALVGQISATLVGDDAAIAAAQLNLDFCTIESPIDGRVGLRQVDAGNFVHASDTSALGIVTITQIHPIAVVFTLPQDTLPSIQTAMVSGKLTVLAYTSDGLTVLGKGELLTTDNAIDQTTGTIKLKAVFPNQDNKLWPGQFVNVRLQLAVERNALVVPSIAVQRSQTNLYVFVLKSDWTVAMQPVEIGQDDGITTVISRGLDDNAKVVVNGMSRLQNGSRVAVTQAKPAS
jgi:multidrug efflux system membrane fusion protein